MSCCIADKPVAGIPDTINHLTRGIQVLTIIAVVSVVAITVLTGLSMADYVDSLLPLYIIPVPISCFFIIKILESCQKSVAKKHNNINMEVYNRRRFPMPKTEKDSKKRTADSKEKSQTPPTKTSEEQLLAQLFAELQKEQQQQRQASPSTASQTGPTVEEVTETTTTTPTGPPTGPTVEEVD